MNIQAHAHYPPSSRGNTRSHSILRPLVRIRLRAEATYHSQDPRSYKTFCEPMHLLLGLPPSLCLGAPSLAGLPPSWGPLGDPPLFGISSPGFPAPSFYVHPGGERIPSRRKPSHPVSSRPMPTSLVSCPSILSTALPSHSYPHQPLPRPSSPWQADPFRPVPAPPIPSRPASTRRGPLMSSKAPVHPPADQPASQAGSHANRPFASHRQTSSSPELTL